MRAARFKAPPIDFSPRSVMTKWLNYDPRCYSCKFLTVIAAGGVLHYRGDVVDFLSGRLFPLPARLAVAPAK